MQQQRFKKIVLHHSNVT